MTATKTNKPTRTLRILETGDRLTRVQIATPDKTATYLFLRHGDRSYSVREGFPAQGEVYHATANVCTCKAGKYRGKCKHSDAIRKLTELSKI